MTAPLQVNKNEQLKIALDASMDGIALLDAAGNYTYLNKEHLSIFGYEKEEELLGKSWEVLYEAAEINRLQTEIFPVLAQEKKWKGETTGKSKTGNPVPQEISLNMLEDGGMICICRNIAPEKEKMKELKLHHEILATTRSMIIVTDPDGKIEWVNKSFMDVTGYTLPEIIGKKPGSFLQGKESEQKEIAKIRGLINQNLPFYAELLNYKKDGTPYWIEIKGQPIFNESGSVEHFFAIEEDITERKNHQKILEESNLRLELALKGIAAATWELNLATGEIYYSDFLYEMTGYNDNEIKQLFGENKHLMHDIDSQKTFADFATFLKSNKDTFESEYRIKHKNGHYIWIHMRAVVSERNNQQEPQKIIGILIDISNIKETQRKLEESEKRYKVSLEASGLAIWEWNLLNNEIFATQEFRKLFGMPDDDNWKISYENMISFVHPDDAPLMESTFKKHFSGETQVVNLEYRFKRFDTGQYEWYQLQGAVIEKNTDQVPVKAVGYSSSIHERKMMELKLKESEERWFNAMVVSGAGFWEYDIEKTKLFFSVQMKRILGYGSSNHIAEDIDYWKGRVHTEDLFIIEEIIRSPSNAFTLEFRILNQQNDYRWISASGICKFNESGKPLQYSGAAYDITEKKKGELALGKAKKMAESSLKAKRRFLANVSHEIRTPMHAIMGLSEQLSQSELRPEQHILIKMINESSKSLMHIINDVLDLSKIEEGKLLIDEIVFDPNKLIQQVFDLFFIEASKKEIEFVLNQNADESSPLIGDPNRIRQILSNVISNAIKFTEKGKIAIDFRVQKTSHDQAKISFICSDTGIGMNDEMKKRIFEEFVQEDESFHRKYGGSGLGLSITQELVKMMKGQIHIESEKNKGTSVSIEIPLKTIKEKEQKINVELPPIDLSKLQKIKVLVAEDNEFNRLLLKFIFEKNHIPFEFAFNGRAAVEKVLSQHFDLILMDIQMPEMDGIEATQILRNNLGNELPVIAVTANAIREELEYYLKVGFNDYLTKPFEERKLLEKMVQFCK